MAANYTLRKITENSWIAHTNGTPVAYINKTPDNYLFVSKEINQKFPDMKAIEKFLGGKIKEQINEASDGLDNAIESEINGFPVKHQNTTIEHAGDRPVYLRGKTQHAAGYWCIKFSKRWVPGFCPLLKTVEQYQSMGPFKTRLEMMTELAAQNRQL